MRWMYSVPVSIIINFIVGIFLWYEILVIAALNWGNPGKEFIIFAIKFSIRFVLVCTLCVWYNYKRYKKVENGDTIYAYSIFYLTLWLPLFAFTVFIFIL